MSTHKILISYGGNRTQNGPASDLEGTIKQSMFILFEGPSYSHLEKEDCSFYERVNSISSLRDQNTGFRVN